MAHGGGQGPEAHVGPEKREGGQVRRMYDRVEQAAAGHSVEEGAHAGSHGGQKA